jgi:transposase
MKTRRQFSREFKVEAVKLVTERGVAVAQRKCVSAIA